MADSHSMKGRKAYWQGEYVDHSQVDVEDGCKLEQAGDIRARHLCTHCHNGHWPRKILLCLLKIEDKQLQACIPKMPPPS